jgi:O-antigen/teichoic acid export membrane protein
MTTLPTPDPMTTLQMPQQQCDQTESVSGPPPRSLRVNFSWTMTGNLIYAASQWGILVLLARLGNPEAVGQFSLGLAITAPIMLFAGLQLRAVQTTDARHLFDFADYAGMRALTTIAAVLMIFAIGATAYRGEIAMTIAAFALSKGIESLSDVVYGLWQQQERLDLVAQSLMLRGVLSLIATAICFAAFHSVWIAVCGMAAAWAVVFAAFDLPHAVVIAGNWQAVLPRFSAPLLKQLVRLSLPLGIVTLLLSFNSNIPRYLISQMRGVRELGVFAALGYVAIAGNMIVNALGQSAVPRLALYSSQGRRREFRSLSNRLMLIGLALGASGVLMALVFGRQIITIVYGREYAQNVGLFIWLMIAAAFSYMAAFAGSSLTAARHFRVQMPLFGFITVLTFVLCLVMVKADGATGAAKALAAAGFVQLAATIGILRYLEAGKTVRV